MTVIVIGLHAQPARTIFITGGNFGPTFINYVAALTKKPNPKICFIPTASADDPNSIIRWYQVCSELQVKPYVLRTFLNSSPDQKTFEEVIMSMDAIVVGGGSTLNMMAIWRAQGIDTVLRKRIKRASSWPAVAPDHYAGSPAASPTPDRYNSVSSTAWVLSQPATALITTANRAANPSISKPSFPANCPPVTPAMTRQVSCLKMKN
jgi:hypothetical protein